jgi:hypothetical protein
MYRRVCLLCIKEWIQALVYMRWKLPQFNISRPCQKMKIYRTKKSLEIPEWLQCDDSEIEDDLVLVEGTEEEIEALRRVCQR